MGLTIGVDVGGTKVAAGVVDEDGKILARARRDTPAKDPEMTEDTIAGVVTELRRRPTTWRRSASARPGSSTTTRATVLFAPNLAWRNEPLRG